MHWLAIKIWCFFSNREQNKICTKPSLNLISNNLFLYGAFDNYDCNGETLDGPRRLRSASFSVKYISPYLYRQCLIEIWAHNLKLTMW